MNALSLFKKALPKAAGGNDNAIVERSDQTIHLHPLLTVLIDDGALKPDDAERAQKVASETGEHILKLITRLGLITPEDWAVAASKYYELQRAPRSEFPKEPILDELFSNRFLKNRMLLPIDHTADVLWLGMADPGDKAALNSIKLASGRDILPVVVALDELLQIHARFWEDGKQAINDIVREIGGTQSFDHDNLDDIIDRAKDAPVVRLVNQLLRDAARIKASDMHVEPYRDRLRVRYRVHGMLRDVENPPSQLGAAVISRFKILAKLDIAERRLPQDGQARINIDTKRIDVRIATIPTIHGESLVIRFLGVEQKTTQLESLGMPEAMQQRLRTQFNAPYGMILVTGPTGSGKSTTLYAGIREINHDDRKILTIEDPVEYQIDGLTQIPVKPDIGLDFAKILRSVVRHDPDVIMVGETRDPETADIAVHAALTGHLLLSTLHTNSAPGAVARMLDMGVESYLLASVLRGVIGQRLVAEICPHCRIPRPPDDAEAAIFKHAGIAVDQETKLFDAPGCDECEGVGFVGRIGIFEFLEITEPLRDLIRDKRGTQALSEKARALQMETMLQYGLRKCLEGKTTFAEVTRVTEDW